MLSPELSFKYKQIKTRTGDRLKLSSDAQNIKTTKSRLSSAFFRIAPDAYQ